MTQAFGNFEFQGRRRQTGFVQSLDHAVQKVRVLELARRQVNGNKKILVPDLVQSNGLAAGDIQHPTAQGFNGPGFFGHGNKLGWRHQAQFGVFPANQGFHAENAIILTHHGLIEKHEFIPFQSPANVGFQLPYVPGPGGSFPK